nr:hypothetical protein [Desulfurococcales archaeon]
YRLSVEGYGFLSTDCSVRVEFSVTVNTTSVTGTIVIENPGGYPVSLENAWPLRVSLKPIDGRESPRILLEPHGGPVEFSGESYVFEVSYNATSLPSTRIYLNTVVLVEMNATVGGDSVSIREEVPISILEKLCVAIVNIEAGTKPGTTASLPLEARRLVIEAPQPGQNMGLVYQVTWKPGTGPVIMILFGGETLEGLAEATAEALGWSIEAGIIDGIGGQDVSGITEAIAEGVECREYSVEYKVYWNGASWTIEEATLAPEALPTMPTPTPTPTVTKPTPVVENGKETETTTPAMGTAPREKEVREALKETAATRAPTQAPQPGEEPVETAAREAPEGPGVIARTVIAFTAGIALSLTSWIMLRRSLS